MQENQSTTSEPADSQVSILILLTFTKDKSQFRACWHLQKTGLTFLSVKNYFELGGFLIGYVIATSEPTDSQVSPFSPTRTTSSLVASQSVMSLRPLNRQIAKSHLLVRQGLYWAWWLLNRLRHCDCWLIFPAHKSRDIRFRNRSCEESVLIRGSRAMRVVILKEGLRWKR